MNLITLHLVSPWISAAFKRWSSESIYNTFKKCLKDCNAFSSPTLNGDVANTNPDDIMEVDEPMDELSETLSKLSTSMSQYLRADLSIDDVSM